VGDESEGHETRGGRDPMGWLVGLLGILLLGALLGMLFVVKD
jgi:hypothetical protein